MKIAIASGKGGTGKTTLAVNLALYASEKTKVVLSDLDVEEPNNQIFLKGDLINSRTMIRMIPKWDSSLCSLCGKCPDWCSFGAVLKMGDRIEVLDNLCHSCYACSELCPDNALPMIESTLGEMREYKIGNLSFVESKLKIGMEMAAPLIAQTVSHLEKHYRGADLQLWDCPPGTSCSVIEATVDADFVILVSEPTPFGLYDLTLAVKTMRYLKKDMAVVINRYGIGNDDIIRYCEEENIPIWAKIPNSRQIAELYSKGEIIYDKIPEFKAILDDILNQMTLLQHPCALCASSLSSDDELEDGSKKADVKEIVIISGKGGTGKTSLAAALSFVAAKETVIADCDVEAPDMHLILQPETIDSEDFYSGLKAVIDNELCNKCNKCVEVCRFDAISVIDGNYIVDMLKCEGCSFCSFVCPTEAAKMEEQCIGEWYLSRISPGSLMSHSKLEIGAENSGKLVVKVKDEAKKIAAANGISYILVDGSPGIGCPVIASLSGADYAVIVIEPTLSGLSDMKRVRDLAKMFRIPLGCIINKADLNEAISNEIKDYLKQEGIELIHTLKYDDDFHKAITQGVSIVEYNPEKWVAPMQSIWDRIKNFDK